jgi:sugar phosphate isomerase/epimerase
MALELTINMGFFSQIAETRGIAEEHGLGIEVQHFADGPTLDGAWREKLAEIALGLKGFRGLLSMHGPYDGLDPGAWDPQLRSISHARYMHAIEIADRLGARIIVFHPWYNPGMRFHGGVPRWAERRTPAWIDLARAAEKYGMTLVLENVWEENPEPQCALIDAVDSPHVRACLDIGHANMTGKTALGDWISELGERLVYVHAHNNSGVHDDHWALTRGTLDVRAVMKDLQARPHPPRVCLEMRNTADQMESLRFLAEA